MLSIILYVFTSTKRHLLNADNRYLVNPAIYTNYRLSLVRDIDLITLTAYYERAGGHWLEVIDCDGRIV